MFNKKKRSISIKEFDTIYAETTVDGEYITKEDINELKTYIDEQNSVYSEKDAAIFEFLKPVRNGVRVNNYVGILETKSGLIIEILPKIYGKSQKTQDKDAIRSLFLKMLKTVRKIDGKHFKLTNLDTKKNNLLEVFISMFLAECDQIIKKGLNANYVAIRRNDQYLKGKFLMTEHIRNNSINLSNFYTEFDEFMIDSPENQLIRTALEFLLYKSRDANNLMLIKEQLTHLEFVSTTSAPDQTIQRVNLGRNYQYYSQALDWCQIFLSHKSFTSFRGSSISLAILFPMEKIFESYISTLFKEFLPEEIVSVQDNPYSLFDKTTQTSEAYRLKPDLVLRFKNETAIIADTKWKILDKFGPSQADLYQMYAYQTRYSHKNERVEKVVLIYPYSEAFQERKFISLGFSATDLAAKVSIKYIDLFSDDKREAILNLIR